MRKEERKRAGTLSADPNPATMGARGMNEKRKHKRHPASEMAYVVGLENPGLITDISRGGLGVNYKGGEEVPEDLIVDLLHAAKSIIIDKVRCRKVRDDTLGKVAVFSYVAERRLGLQFVDPTQEQLDALEMFKGIDH